MDQVKYKLNEYFFAKTSERIYLVERQTSLTRLLTDQILNHRLQLDSDFVTRSIQLEKQTVSLKTQQRTDFKKTRTFQKICTNKMTASVAEASASPDKERQEQVSCALPVPYTLQIYHHRESTQPSRTHNLACKFGGYWCAQLLN